MDQRRIILEHLMQAQLHVALGQNHIARQYEVISGLERDGHDTDARHARELLATFEEMQEGHITRRGRLERELLAAAA